MLFMAILSFYSQKSVYLLIGFLFCLVYSSIYWSNTSITPSLYDVSVLGVFAIIQLIYIVASWWYIRKSLFDAYIVFVAVLYAFNLGQPILEAMGTSFEFRRLWNGYAISSADYYAATYYSMLFILFFHFGSLWALRPIKTVQEKCLGEKGLKEVAAVRKASAAIAVLSAPFYLYNLIQDFIIVRVVGYAGLYETDGSRLISIIADLFTPAMMAYFCACLLLHKNVKISGFLVATLLFLPPFYLGGRTNAMIIAALLLIIYASIRTVNVRKFMIIASLAIAMLFIMHIIAVTRTEAGRSLETLQQASEDSENPVVSTLSEMGWSLYPLALTIEAIPAKKDYAYCASYFWAFVSLVPNIGFWDGVHPGKKNDPGYWLNQYSDLDYGIGYSLTAGAYNELGLWGIILMFLYGCLFCSVFSYVSSVHVYRNPLKFIFALLFLWFAIMFVRNSYDSFMRNIVYDVLPLFFLTKILVVQKAIKNKKAQKYSLVLQTEKRN